MKRAGFDVLRRYLCLVAVAAALLTARASRADGGPVIPPARGEDAPALIADVGFGRPTKDGYVFANIAVDRDRIVFPLEKKGRVVGSMKLVPIAEASPGDVVTKSFAVKLSSDSGDPQVSALLHAAAMSVASHDDGGFYVSPEEAPRAGPNNPPEVTPADAPHRPRFGSRLPLEIAAFGAAGFLLALAALRKLGGRIATDFKLVHILPATVQITIFAYWALYWRPLIEYFPPILVQLVFAYYVDAILSLATRRRVVISVAPIPIVLSINLFVQFTLGLVFLPLAAILIAFLSKVFLRWRERDYAGHIFNPSALGVTIVAFVHLALPELGSGDNAIRFSLPPNITEVIFLLALIPQTRRPIVLVTFFTVAAMLAYRRVTGFSYFFPLWAPVLLSAALLGTDPATIPRTGPGRVVFGCLLGLGFEIAATILQKTGHSDFYGKVIALPFVNLLTPWCDRLGSRMSERVRLALAPEVNKSHILAWIGLFLLFWSASSKTGAFRPEEHADNATPLIVASADGGIGCKDNPMFCETFTFGSELAGWARRLRR